MSSLNASSGSTRARRQAKQASDPAPFPSPTLPQTNHAEFMARLRLSQDHREKEAAEKEAAANAEYARKTAADQVILLITHVNSVNLLISSWYLLLCYLLLC